MTYLIYETANFHGGDVSKLMALTARLASMETSSRCGIKFHPIAADALATPSFSAYALYQKFELSTEVWRKIIAQASKSFDVWLELADAHCVSILKENVSNIKGMKLQASMLENEEVFALLKSLEMKDKYLIANISGFEVSEIEKILERLSVFGFSAANLTLQVGFQSYPTAIEDSQLNKIAVLRAAFPGYRLGIADHVSASDPYALILPAIASALGCALVEKHICLDRSETEFDAFSALEPEELRVMQGYLDAAERSFSSTFISVAEKSYLKKSRLLPCSAREKREGALVSSRDIVYRRQAGAPLTMSQIRRCQEEFRILAHSCQPGDAFQETSFRKARVAAVIACRMKSFRLQNKALLSLGGKSVIERCIENCQRIHHADAVFLATSTHEQDALLEEPAKNMGCGFYRGDPDDVMVRYLDLAHAHEIDVIVRVTGDNPFISPEIADYLLADHFRAGADFTRASNDAVGTGAHIINVEAMRRVVEILGGAPMSEYMNWYFENNPEFFSINIVDIPQKMSRNYRLTLDYEQDYMLFSSIIELLDEAGSPHTLENIFSILDRSPELVRINADVQVKYQSDQELIRELEQKTRFPDQSSSH
jgi:N,N'-diacetyllegionaminate synthase